jgi:general L-amino acid transport system permease protein
VLRHAERVQSVSGERPTTWWKSLCIFVLPLFGLLYALGFHFDYPALKGLNFTGGLQLRNAFIALWIGLSVYTGAFIAEIVRSGILAISRGQSEAAHALGLTPARTMRLVILPQALRIIIPPMISQFLNITKNTSLGLAVGYMDLRSTLGGITINQTGRELEGMLLMMLIYVSISLAISGVMNVYNGRARLKER